MKRKEGENQEKEGLRPTAQTQASVPCISNMYGHKDFSIDKSKLSPQEEAILPTQDFSIEAATQEEAIEKARMYVHTAQERGVHPPEVHKILRSYKLDEKLVKVLDEYAARETLDKSDVVAEALKQFLDLKDEAKQKADRIQRINAELKEERIVRDAIPCPLCGKHIDYYEDEPFEWDEEKQGEWPGTYTYSTKLQANVHIECLHKIGESEFEQ